jgi:lipoate-protein ligase A
VLEVDVIVQPSVQASISEATDRYLLQVVGQNRRPVLRVSEQQGRVLSLGRYHLAPEPVRGSAVQVTRRVCGGRVRPAGEGFRTVSLVLPHRSALVSDDRHALAPSQVLNRFVRGFLQGCREMGIAAFYPGRDLVTVGGSILAMVSFECSETGSTLLEAHVATNSEFAALADLLETADPDATISAELWAPQATTSLARRLGRAADIEETAAMLCRGYASHFPMIFRSHALSSAEMNAIQANADSATESWVASRRARSDMDRHAISPVQVGVLEVHFSLDEEHRIDSILLAGDFIANSPAIDALERRLHGCPLQLDAIDRVVNEVLDGRENFILGLGKLDRIARLLTGGSGA